MFLERCFYRKKRYQEFLLIRYQEENLRPQTLLQVHSHHHGCAIEVFFQQFQYNLLMVFHRYTIRLHVRPVLLKSWKMIQKMHCLSPMTWC